MNFAGVGPAELLLILIVALLVFGPQKLPQVARDLGKAIGKWRQALDEIQSVTSFPMEEMKGALDSVSKERELQEAVQRVVRTPNQGPEDSSVEVAVPREDTEEPEVENECQT
jgi:sec-independent protein translocase protein TatB